MLALGRLHRSAVGRRLGADVPFCVVGGRAEVCGHRGRVSPLPFEPRSFVLLVPPLRGGHRRRLPGLGRPGPRPGRRRQRPHGRRPGRGARPGPLAGPLAEATGRRPRWPAADRPGSSRAAPAELGLEGRTSLTLQGEEGSTGWRLDRAADRAVRHRSPESGRWTGAGVQAPGRATSRRAAASASPSASSCASSCACACGAS